MHTTQLSIHHIVHVYTYLDTQIHLHTHTLTCRQTQPFNLPFVTCTYIPRTHTLTRLLEKGVNRKWEGMVLCIRPSLAIGIHRGTLAYIRWGIRLECARGERPGEGDKDVGMQPHVCIHKEPCTCVCGRDMQILYL